MLDRIRAIFGSRRADGSSAKASPAPGAAVGSGVSGTAAVSGQTAAPNEIHIAACALLLDLAWADGEFSESEQEHLHEVLARHFGLTAEEGHAVVAVANEERRAAVDHFSFTSVLKRNYDVGQRVLLAEVMWGLVLSDGEVAEHEHYLARKIANLLDLEPAYLASAKQAAAARLEGEKT